MPNARWWDFERNTTDFGDIKPDTRDVARIVIMDFMLVHGNDWFVASLAQPVGTLCAIDALVVQDVFGGLTLIERADAALGAPGHRWTMFSTGVRGDPARVADFFVLSPSVASVALDGPAGRCAPTQNPCTAYNYGWNAAADAVDRGDAAGADPAMWWLDVETANYWADPPDRALNARVIQAALDLLRSRGLSAGIYSINEMWSRIAGTQYRPGVPVWYAETDPASGYPSAPHYCDPAYGFTGGTVWLVQWTDTVDHDYACRISAPSPQPAPSPGICLPRPLPLCVLTPAPPPSPRPHLP